MADKKNYSSIYNIKDFVRYTIMPKYWDMSQINDLNVGLLGMVTECESNNLEDALNTTTTYIKESFPNTAMMPSTIYDLAALFKMNNLFATPASMDIILLINENDIKKHMAASGDLYKFYIDSDLSIDVEGVQYMLDYDVIIQAKPYKKDFVYTSLYDFNYRNSLNLDTQTPYIKNIRYSGEEGKFLGLFVKVHQVNKTTYEEPLISNNIINYPKFQIEYEDMLGNFEVYYKEIGTDNYIQLTKVLKNSPPLEVPFCYYTFLDQNKIEISFSSKDRYFQPKFGSDVRIELFTTLGEKGNFELYKGNNVTVIPQSTQYSYNNNLIMYAIPQTESEHGIDDLEFDGLKSLVCEKYATINTITTESDLYYSFANSKYKTGLDIIFRKKRDDAFLRLFSAFTLFKDSFGEIYHTNTLDLTLANSSDKPLFDSSGEMFIKPGSLFKYADGETTKSISQIPGKTINDLAEFTDEEFIFTNPFLISIISRPSTVVGYYLNSIDEKILVNYTYMNEDSPNQFICNMLHIKRNALQGENKYKITVAIGTSGELTVNAFNDGGLFMNRIKVQLVIDDNGEHSVYIPFKFVTFDKESNVFMFEGEIETDDVVTVSEKIRCLNVYDFNTHEKVTKIVPYDKIISHIQVFVEDENPIAHEYMTIPGLENTTHCNSYSTIDNNLKLLLPFHFIRSTLVYEDIPGESNDKYRIAIKQIPMVSARDIILQGKFPDLMDRLVRGFNFISDTLILMHNNFSIDLKFIGTYGRAEMFELVDRHKLDRLDCRITFDVKFYQGVDQPALINKIKEYIQEYFEEINVRSEGDMSVKVSNLIQQVENTFDEVDYLIFKGINDYSPLVQVLINKGPVNPNALSNVNIYNFIPEYVTMRLSDIFINPID